ncbi:MAG: hypothetical protein ACHREM_16585, partial [Polyangiales bacterium]
MRLASLLLCSSAIVASLYGCSNTSDTPTPADGAVDSTTADTTTADTTTADTIVAEAASETPTDAGPTWPTLAVPCTDTIASVYGDPGT